jgi:hypothetical protein
MQGWIAPRDERGVRTESRLLDSGPTMLLEGPWDAHYERAWGSGAYAGVSLNTSWGWSGDTGFLAGLAGLRGLHVLSPDPVEVPVPAGNQIEAMVLGAPIVGQAPDIGRVRWLGAQWSPGVATALRRDATGLGSALRDLLLTGLDDPAVEAIGELSLPSVRTFTVKESRITDARPLGRPFDVLDSLQLLHLGARCADVSLSVNCPDVTIGTLGLPLDTGDLVAVTGMRTLTLDCRRIVSFEAAERLTSLEDLTIRGTVAIREGGLLPLARAPRLSHLGVDQRRKYADDLRHLAAARPDLRLD